MMTILLSCIIKCVLPICIIKPNWTKFSEHFLSYFVSDEICSPEPSATFEIYIKQDLPATNILEIIDVVNPTFEKLTDYKNWTQSI